MAYNRDQWPEAVVFDLDGTLVDSALDMTNALNFALERRGLPPFSVEKVKEMIGGGVPKLAERALRAHGVSRIGLIPLVADFARHYRQNLTTHTTVFEGAYDMLEALLADSKKLGLCTNKRHDLTVKMLKQLDLCKYFSCVVGERFGRARKPDPAPLRSVLNALNVLPQNAVMVGDSSADVGCAKAAGVASIVVSFGYSQIPTHALGGDAVCSHLANMRGCFDEIAFKRMDTVA